MKKRSALLLLAAFFAQLTLNAQQHSVAITFDDLPLADAGSSEATGKPRRLTEIRSVNKAMLKALKRHHARAIAFVNEEKVIRDGLGAQNRAILKDWIALGNELGNHGFAHRDLNALSVEEFEREVTSGEASISPLMAHAGKSLQYLRFPFNHTGDTQEKHDAVSAFLKQNGYQIATCTIDTSDWIFARAYGLMLDRRDSAGARRLRAAYLEYSQQEIEYYARLSTQIFGREIPQVMLLHANRLNADTLDSILTIFEKLGYRFVALQQVQSDSAYQTPDTYITQYGWMWGYRWAKELKIKVDGRLEPEVPKWVEEYK